MAGMTTTGSVPPAVPAGGKGKKPAPGKKGVNPFVASSKTSGPTNSRDRKGAAPTKAAPGKKGGPDAKTLSSMAKSLKF